MATSPEDSVEIINSSVNSQVYETVASLEENEFRIFLEEVTSQDRKKADKGVIAQAAQILLRKEEDALKEESGSGEDTQELLSACHKRKRLLKGKGHCDNSSSAAARTSTGGSLGSLQDLTETKVPETSTAAATKSGGSCGNLSRGSFKTQAPLKQRGKRLKVGRASTSQREGGSLQNLSKTEVASNEAKKLHKSGSLSQVFADVGGARLKNRRQKTSSESSGSRTGRKSEEKDVGSDGECSEIPYRLLVTSPLPVANEVEDVDSKMWNRDRMSDVASGESTEEDGESFHSVARSKLSDSTMSSYANATELTSVVTHTAHKDNDFNPIGGDSEVDKKIKFCLGPTQENSLESGRTHISLIPSTFFEGKLSSRILDQENIEKKYKNGKSENSENSPGDRSLFDTMTEFLPRNRHFTYLQKSSLENQHIKVSESSTSITINSLKTSYDDSAVSHRSNGFPNGGTNQFNYYRMKAKCDKKKILKKKNEIPIEKTPGYVGDAPFSEILTFINDKNSNQKGKKKHKNKKEDSKDEKDTSKKKKNGERILNNISALTKTNDLSDGKDLDRKKRKGDSLRGTSSVEDLVSKSKQNDGDLFLKKQVAVEDGDVSHYLNSFTDSTNTTSEFSHDFYQVGDATLNDEILQESGEFEIVNRKKSRKNRITSTPSIEKDSIDKVNENTLDKQKLSNSPVKDGKKGGLRPAMNFSEGLKFDGDLIFNKWPSNKGSNCDRIGHTTSAPQSEGSDSDGDDSVHSMPVKSMTPKPELRHHPQSSDSTPQTSYANIAKLASKKRLEKVQKTNKDAMIQMRKSDLNLYQFPPLAENEVKDASSQINGVCSLSDQDNGRILSPSDLIIPAKIRSNSISNELPSMKQINNNVCPIPNENFDICHVRDKLKSKCANVINSYSELRDENSIAERDCFVYYNNSTSKIQNRNEPKLNPIKLNHIKLSKSVPSKTEPAVVFTDKTKVHESINDIEFGFGLEEILPTEPVNSAKSDISLTKTVPDIIGSHSKMEIRNETSVADLFRRLFVPPKEEVFPNHNELCKLFTTGWENTLKMMEEDPENIQVWRCPSKCDSPSKISF